MSEKQLSLYIHSPFCSHKCGYCDFNSWAQKDVSLNRSWLTRIKRDILYWRDKFSQTSLNWRSVFFGGGTPSLLPDEILRELGEFLFSQGITSSGLEEFTVELNPEDVSLSKLDVFKQMGVSRFSMGVQSFQDSYLRRLERQANVATNHRALELISTYWKGPWSLDLMYALPGQTLEEFQQDLDAALVYNPQHLSLFQLTLSTARSKNWDQAEESELAEFFTLKKKVLESLGFEHYEISNFAKNAEVSIHNKVYWELGEFLGVGPGAYGMLSPLGMLPSDSLGFDRFGFHQKAPSNFDSWINDQRSMDEEIVEKRDFSLHAKELLLMGLRLKEGVKKARLGEYISAQLMSSNATKGLLEENSDSISCSSKGMYLLDYTVKMCFYALDQAFPGLDSVQVDPIFGR